MDFIEIFLGVFGSGLRTRARAFLSLVVACQDLQPRLGIVGGLRSSVRSGTLRLRRSGDLLLFLQQPLRLPDDLGPGRPRRIQHQCHDTRVVRAHVRARPAFQSSLHQVHGRIDPRGLGAAVASRIRQHGDGVVLFGCLHYADCGSRRDHIPQTVSSEYQAPAYQQTPSINNDLASSLTVTQSKTFQQPSAT